MLHVLLLDLKDDPAGIAEYERWHAAGAVPAAVTASIRRAGIEDMRIFRAGNRLVMLMETGAAYDPAAKAAGDAADPDVQAWETLMDRFQQAIPAAVPGTKWTEAGQIFALHEQEGA
ncbi:L-rhamnose mutarotase [Sphingomonas sp. CARO-RG-8B-R24-01]|uniref:L-rhamnose mutarotase n=1 Tax=Sphingomonas sp. CARO-RG-8B-R24-01 TaxID=2914831 RepID=UPI001F586A0F|nr:L-rhamnose mutarotase [Sphingomonas sp. CARO-RG-8B-R24-01]